MHILYHFAKFLILLCQTCLRPLVNKLRDLNPTNKTTVLKQPLTQQYTGRAARGSEGDSKTENPFWQMINRQIICLLEYWEFKFKCWSGVEKKAN